MKLALFDLDGTITQRDTFVDFIRFSVDLKSFAIGMAKLSPYIVAFSLGAITHTQIKERYLTYFFRGWKKSKLDQYGQAYAMNVLPLLIKPAALDRLNWHRSEGHRIIIVTASIGLWVSYWCEQLGVEIISSELAFENDRVTGRLASLNCAGQEKVNRLKDLLDITAYEFIFAYGDSQGDLQMLNIADEQHYRLFPQPKTANPFTSWLPMSCYRRYPHSSKFFYTDD